jgi:ABC-type branched-subunit amino acid transport system substrate-binding protein
MSKSRLRLVLTAFAALALSFGIAACGDDDDEGDGGTAEIAGGEESLDLTIGDSLPLTGDLADFGPPGEKAADLAIEEINSAVEEVGADHTVEIVHEDNETNPQAAVQAARSMVADGASCITGAWASADTIPTARSVSIREGVLQISPASTSDEITTLEDDGLLNRTSPPDSFQGPTLAQYMDEVLNGAEGKTVNVGARNDAYGEGLAETFSAAWEELGGEIGEEVIYEVEQPNYDSEAQQIASGNPDATVIVDFSDAYPRVGPALARAGVDFSTTFGTDGLASTSLPADAGEESTEGMRGTAPGSPDDEEQTVAFDELYTSAEPTDVERQTFDSQNFDAVILCYLAAVAAGSTEGEDMAGVVQAISAPGGTEYTWEELPEAIEALQNGDDIDYLGASGQLDLDEAGDATAGVYDIWEYRNGKFEVTDETPVALPE